MTAPKPGDPRHRALREAALREAVERYERPLLAYALRLLDGHNAAAQDAVQETFLRLCREPPERLEGRLAPWLFAVCRHRVIDMRRSSHRIDAQLPAAATDPSPGPEQLAQRAEQVDHLQRLIAELPQRQQELLHLRLQAGLSYREIAEVTGLTVTNVGYHLHAAVRRLRDAMIPEHRPLLGTERLP